MIYGMYLYIDILNKDMDSVCTVIVYVCTSINSVHLYNDSVTLFSDSVHLYSNSYICIVIVYTCKSILVPGENFRLSKIELNKMAVYIGVIWFLYAQYIA